MAAPSLPFFVPWSRVRLFRSFYISLKDEDMFLIGCLFFCRKIYTDLVIYLLLLRTPFFWKFFCHSLGRL